MARKRSFTTGAVVPKKADKPCPICYSPMRYVAKNVYACERHGENPQR